MALDLLYMETLKRPRSRRRTWFLYLWRASLQTYASVGASAGLSARCASGTRVVALMAWSEVVKFLAYRVLDAVLDSGAPAVAALRGSIARQRWRISFLERPA